MFQITNDKVISIKDLKKIKGIGPSLLSRIEDYLVQQDKTMINSPSYCKEIHITSNSLIQGDCLFHMNGIPDNSIPLIICDLPYGMTQNKWDNLIPFSVLWSHYKRILTDDGVAILFGMQPFMTEVISSNLDWFKEELIWEKTTPTGHLNSGHRHMRKHENIAVFSKSSKRYYPQKTTGHTRKVSLSKHKKNSKQTTNYNTHNFKDYDSCERFPTTILTYASDKQKEALHPTQKPIELLRYLIKTYSIEGEVVLDNTMGSGSTCIAALLENRKYIGIEKDHTYYEIAKERLEKYQKNLTHT